MLQQSWKWQPLSLFTFGAANVGSPFKLDVRGDAQRWECQCWQPTLALSVGEGSLQAISFDIFNSGWPFKLITPEPHSVGGVNSDRQCWELIWIAGRWGVLTVGATNVGRGP